MKRFLFLFGTVVLAFGASYFGVSSIKNINKCFGDESTYGDEVSHGDESAYGDEVSWAVSNSVLETITDNVENGMEDEGVFLLGCL